ncbi:MAG: hypothetical protein K9K38_15345 [Rhodoferax sp.]|nr:hypothetical protein [Rhodoferax sp.]
MNATVSISWLRKAAEQGHPEAQFYFALKCAGGEGMPRDRMRAYFWLLLASSQCPALAAHVRDEVQNSLTASQCEIARTAASRWTPSV